MIVPIRCFSCGSLIANKFSRYTEIVKIENMINKIEDSSDEEIISFIDELRSDNYDMINNSSKSERLETIMTRIVEYIIANPNDEINENNNSKKLALDAVGLRRYCCRMQFLGTRNIIDVVATDRKNI